MSETVNSLFSFLDEADRKEAKRSVPFVGDIQSGIESRKKQIKKEIKKIDKNIKELNEIKETIYLQHKNYTSEIASIQQKMENEIEEKEEFSKKIEISQKELRKLSEDNDVDPNEQIKELVKQAIKDLKNQLNEKLNKQLHKIMDDCSKQAAEEFAPHVQKLKSKHKSDVTVLKAENSKEIEKIKQNRYTSTKTFLDNFQENFREQTTMMLQSIMKENSQTLERYRQKNEKELALYEVDFQQLARSIENQVSDIKKRNQRDIEIEKNSYERMISDCKQDVIIAKRNAEKRMQQIQEKRKESNEIANALPAFELEKRLNERNKVIIQRRKEELNNEVVSLKEKLQRDVDESIKNAEEENKRKTMKLNDDIEYLEGEKERITQLHERYEAQRVRAEKRKEISSDELENAKKEVSRLKDRLFELTSMKTKANSTITSSTNYKDELRSKIHDVKLEEMQKRKEYEAKMNIIKERHEQALKKTKEKVKAVISSKDAQIAQLSQQLKKANEMLITATKAMQK